MTSTLRTLDRTDLELITPNRLEDVIEFEHLAATPVVSHRGHDADLDRLVSRLGAALDHTAIEAGESSAPSNLPETNAVDTVLEALVERVPRWFDHGAAPEEYDAPISDACLSVNEICEAYWQGELNPETMPVAGDDWRDQKRVVLPLLALVWDRLDAQQRADRQARIIAGQKAITAVARRKPTPSGVG